MRRILVIAALLAGTAVHAQTYTDVWNDARNRSDFEMDYALNVDSTACDQQTGLQTGRPSAKYRKCMGAHGWSYSHLVKKTGRHLTRPTPPPTRSGPESINRMQTKYQGGLTTRSGTIAKAMT
jgi:hypothetical protein